MYESSTAICPYYREHEAKRIKCEGGRSINCRNFEDIKKIIKNQCSTELWKTCPIAKRLNELYEAD